MTMVMKMLEAGTCGYDRNEGISDGRDDELLSFMDYGEMTVIV